MRKASANIWWIIIGAVIALVVLIILMVMFSGKTSKVEQGLSTCEGKEGVCVFEESDCPGRTLKSTIFDCSSGEVCCIGTPVECTDSVSCKECITDSAGKSWCK